MDFLENFFLFEGAEDTPPDPETGTNEPVSVGDMTDTENPEDQPDTSLAEDLTGTDSGDLQAQISELNAKIEELSKNFDLGKEVEILKKRLDNINIPSDSDLNDSLFQTASSDVKYIKRALRRVANKISKKSNLNGEQQSLIISELEQNKDKTCQEVAFEFAKNLNVSEQDIIDFIRNTDYRFRHRERRASIIDWDSLN